MCIWPRAAAGQLSFVNYNMIVMKRIKNIIFDFGGVLVDWDPRYVYRSYFKTEEEMEYFLGNICTLEWNSRQDCGNLMADATRERVALFPEYKEPIEMFYANWGVMLHSDIPETADFLREVKAAGYGIYGLTNWSHETIHVAFERYPVFSEFDGIVVSGVEKLLKPDPRLYQILLDRYGLKADECVFLDDNQANVDAANALGITAIRFTTIEEVRPRLRELGILA